MRRCCPVVGGSLRVLEHLASQFAEILEMKLKKNSVGTAMIGDDKALHHVLGLDRRDVFPRQEQGRSAWP